MPSVPAFWHYTDVSPLFALQVYTSIGWAKYSHVQKSIDRFGASAPAAKLYEKFGFTGEAIALKANKVVEHYKSSNTNAVSPIGE